MQHSELLSIMDDDDLVAVEEVMKKSVLKKYKISQNQKGFYYCYVKGDDGKRKQVCRKTYNDLVSYLMSFEASKKEDLTLDSLYENWIKSKELEAPTVNNARRLRDDWRRYYEDDPIIFRPMADISVQEWYEWKIGKIKSMKLTAKQKTNMNTIANGIYDYAIRLGLLNTNTSRVGGRGIPKVLTDVNEKTKPKEEETFMKDETEKAIRWLEQEFTASRSIHRAALLALAGNFFLGLRVGELAALRVDDIRGNLIHIHSQEVENYPDGVHRDGFIVAPYTKKNRVRDVPISNRSQKYLDMLHEFRRENGITSEFLVCDTQNRRIPAYIYEKFMKKLCDGIGTPRKGNHGIRKAAISAIASVDLPLAAHMAGHKSQKTTLDHYVYNQDTVNEITDKLNRIFSTESSNIRLVITGHQPTEKERRAKTL